MDAAPGTGQGVFFVTPTARTSVSMGSSMHDYQAHGNAQAPYVAIIILTFEDSGRALRCLDSVRKEVGEDSAILVIDNGSGDGSSDTILQHLRGGERLLVLPSNLGFAGGMNAGLREALRLGVRFAVLLNNDTVLEPGVLAELLEFMESREDVGVSGPRIHMLSEPDTPQFPRYFHTDAPVDDPKLSGAAFIVRTKAVERAGLFDETYFIFWEETDLFQSILRAGWRVVYVPTQSKVLHEVSSASGKLGGLYLYYFLRNEFLYKRRWEPGILTLLRTTRSHLYSIFASRNRIGIRVMALLHGWILWVGNPAPTTSFDNPHQGIDR